MKKILIISNLIFFLVGNVLLSNTAHLLEHDHSHDYDHSECEECVIIKNSSNYRLDFDKVEFLNENEEFFIIDSICLFESEVLQKYCSRAPPTSL